MTSALGTSGAATEAELQQQITALQQKLRSLSELAGMRVILAELHDNKTGRMDAQKVADYMGVPLKRLAEGLALNYKTVHRSPAAEALQSSLRPIKRSLEILHAFFHKPELVRAWLNTPHPDLDGDTALATILENQAAAVQTVLENALAGVPV